MPTAPKPPPELLKICTRWSKRVPDINDQQDRIQYFQKELPGLLLNKKLFAEILKKVITGGSYPNLRQATMFENEFLLYLNSRRLFSLRMFIFGPKEYTPVHDHNSWGVTGNVSGILEVVRYVRQDDGSKKDFARLREFSRSRLVPGETELTLALDAGIHQTGNPASETMIMISVYGPSIRRLYTHFFDIRKNRASKNYPPKLKKKIMASRALQTLNQMSGSDQTGH